jgi:hypothetical protein
LIAFFGLWMVVVISYNYRVKQLGINLQVQHCILKINYQKYLVGGKNKVIIVLAVVIILFFVVRYLLVPESF